MIKSLGLETGSLTVVNLTSLGVVNNAIGTIFSLDLFLVCFSLGFGYENFLSSRLTNQINKYKTGIL